MARIAFLSDFNSKPMSSVQTNIKEVTMIKPMDATTPNTFYNASGSAYSANIGQLIGISPDKTVFAADSNYIQSMLPNPLQVSSLEVTGSINASTINASTVNANNGNFNNLTVTGNTILGNSPTDTITLNGTTTGSNASFNNLTVTGNTTLGDSSSDTIILNGTVQGTHFGDIRANSVIANTLTFNGDLYEPDPFSSLSEAWVPYQPYIIGTNSSVHPTVVPPVDLTANKFWIEVSGSSIFLNVYIPHGRAGNIAGYYRCQLTERPST